MTLGIAVMAAAIAGLAWNPIPADAANIKVAGAGKVQKEVVLRAKRPRRVVHGRRYIELPRACDAVIFPRSPLCDNQPVTIRRYVGFTWF
jgi:hypothetical protein